MGKLEREGEGTIVLDRFQVIGFDWIIYIYFKCYGKHNFKF